MKQKKPSLKRLTFVNEHLQCWKASEAARRAVPKGMAVWQRAWRMSRNVEVQAASSERIQHSAMAADEALARLAPQTRGELPCSGYLAHPLDMLDIRGATFE